MNFEPQKFFVGLIDFFAVLLPGAVLTYLLRDELGPFFLGRADYERLDGTQESIVFLFTAYLLGHFVFLLGSWLLDDRLYDPIRNATDAGLARQLAKGEKPPWRLTRQLARWLIKDPADAAVRHAARIRDHYLGPLHASSAINAFQWSKIRLATERPEALGAVHRFEADSKFFRSLFIVLAILILWGLKKGLPPLAMVSAALLVLAF